MSTEDISGEELLDNNEGWVVGVRGARLLRLPTEKNMVTIANIGGGKGTSVAIPNFLTHEGSIFSIEISGTTYNETVNFRKNVLKQDIHVVDPFGATGVPSARINLLETLDPGSPRFFSEAQLFAKSILKSDDGQKEQSPYWERTPHGLLLALIIYVRTHPDIEEEDRHLGTIAKLLSKFPSDEWKELMQQMALDTGPYHTTLNREGNYFSGHVDENIRSIVSSVSSAFQFAENPQIADIIKDSSFDLADLRNKKSTIYVVMPEINDYHSSSTWLRLLVERAFAVCPNLGEGGSSFSHNDRVLFFLDEFTQLGKLDAIDLGMVTARQKGITIWVAFQDLGRARKVYGREITSSLLGSAGCVQIFDVGDEDTPKYVSERLGKNIVYIPQIQHGTNWGTSDQRNWTQGISLGLSNSVTENHQFSDAVTWNDTHSKSHSTGSHDNKNSFENYGFQTNFYGGTRVHGQEGNKTHGGGTGTGTSVGDSTGQARTDGGSRTIGSTTGNTQSQNWQDMFSEGGGYTTSEGGSYSVTYSVHILPRLEPSQVEDVLGSNNRQILFIRTGDKVLRLIDQRAQFFKVPFLSRRAKGPEIFSPQILPKLEMPPALTYQPAVSVDFPEIKMPVQIDGVKECVPFNLSEMQIGEMEISDPTKPVSLGQANRIISEEANNRFGIPQYYQNLETDIFGSIAREIEMASKNIFDTQAEHVQSIQAIWDELEEISDIQADRKKDLDAYQQKLIGKLDKLSDFEIQMDRYRSHLLDDRKQELKFVAGLEKYRAYLDFLHALRTGWTAIGIPQRPEKIGHSYSEDRSDEALDNKLGAGIRRRTFVIPDFPFLSSGHKREAAPESMPVTPYEELMKMGVKLPDGSRLTLREIEDRIEARKETHHRLFERLKPIRSLLYEGMTLEDLKLARRLIISRVKDETLPEIHKFDAGQKDFEAWLRNDRALADQFLSFLKSRNESLEVRTSFLKGLDERLNKHRAGLEERFENLNIANQILEARRSDRFDEMAEWVQWDRLESQSQELLPAPEQSGMGHNSRNMEEKEKDVEIFERHHEEADIRIARTSKQVKPPEPRI